MPGRPKPALDLTPEERTRLEKLSRSRAAPSAVRKRSSMILRAADGESNSAIARDLGCSAQTVGAWRSRYLEHGIEGLSDQPRSGRPRNLSKEDEWRLLAWTLMVLPEDRSRWSAASLGDQLGLTERAVRAVWEEWEISANPGPIRERTRVPVLDQIIDVAGIYVSAAVQAIVLYGRRPPQASGDGLMVRLPELTMSRSDEDIVDRIRDSDIQEIREFKRFLNTVRSRVPVTRDVHVLVHAHSRCMMALARRWCAERPHFFVHPYEKSDAWLTRTEIWIGYLREKPGNVDAQKAVGHYRESSTEENAPPWFEWTAGRGTIMPGVTRKATRQRYRRRRGWPQWKRRLANNLAMVWKGLHGEGKVLVVTCTYRADGRIDASDWVARAKRDERRLKDKWRHDWGRMPAHIIGREATQRSVPHFHLMIPYSDDESRAKIEIWLSETWSRIIGEAVSSRTSASRPVVLTVYEADEAIDYLLKDVLEPTPGYQSVGSLPGWNGWSASRPILTYARQTMSSITQEVNQQAETISNGSNPADGHPNGANTQPNQKPLSESPLVKLILSIGGRLLDDPVAQR